MKFRALFPCKHMPSYKANPRAVIAPRTSPLSSISNPRAVHVSINRIRHQATEHRWLYRGNKYLRGKNVSRKASDCWSRGKLGWSGSYQIATLLCALWSRAELNEADECIIIHQSGIRRMSQNLLTSNQLRLKPCLDFTYTSERVLH